MGEFAVYGNSDLKFYGYKNTNVQQYANDYGIDFIAFGSCDANADTEVNLVDLTMMVRTAIGSTELTELQTLVCDTNADSKINTVDITKLQRYLLGVTAEV